MLVIIYCIKVFISVKYIKRKLCKKTINVIVHYYIITALYIIYNNMKYDDNILYKNLHFRKIYTKRKLYKKIINISNCTILHNHIPV